MKQMNGDHPALPEDPLDAARGMVAGCAIVLGVMVIAGVVWLTMWLVG